MLGDGLYSRDRPLDPLCVIRVPRGCRLSIADEGKKQRQTPFKSRILHSVCEVDVAGAACSAVGFCHLEWPSAFG